MKPHSFKVILLILVIIAMIFVVIAYQFVEPPLQKNGKIATGRENGGYHNFALEYQKELAKDDFHLDIIPTAGSIEVLEKISTGEVLFGLVQGGVAKKGNYRNIKSLGSLFYEPIWFFHRKEEQFHYLSNVKGKRIAIGEYGSGTQPVALQLLQDNQITEENTQFFKLSLKEAAQQLIEGKIDGAFFVMSLNSEIISKLLYDSEIEIFDFKRSLAYTSRYPYLTTLELGQGMIDLKLNIPLKSKTLLATTATIVAKEDLDPNLIYLILKTMKKVHSVGGIFETDAQFPSTNFVDIPVHIDAAIFLKNGPSFIQRYFPFWMASHIDRLKIMFIPLLLIWSPFVFYPLKAFMPIYRWRMRAKIYCWYKIIIEVDRKILLKADIDLEEEIKRMKELEGEILKQISIPLSFMGEFYALRAHIKLIRKQLEERTIWIRRKTKKFLITELGEEDNFLHY
jgi:TRAP transporter TAXI family solute receptor